MPQKDLRILTPMNIETSPLITDIYQLTMTKIYHEQGMEDTAVFEFFFRKLPKQRHFLLNVGLEQVIQYLENFQFTCEELNFLSQDERFDEDFINYLSKLRFTGEVNAMPEGSVAFPNEPVLQVIAPLPQAQIIESRLINLLQYPMMIASKALRCRLAAPDQLLVDFGMRRAHGSEAALLAARASYIAGFDGTSTVMAKARYGVPLYGTMAHAFIQAHDNEEQAFRRFAYSLPNNTIFLIDTYDIAAGTQKVIDLAPELKQHGIEVKGVRLDSNNLGEQSQMVRQMLDQAGLTQVKIMCSGDLDEYKAADLAQANYPIDGMGIGTKMDTCHDMPFLNCVYKLQEYAGAPRCKYSASKQTYPGKKQVYRYYDDNGLMSHDVVTLADDTNQTGQALLQPVMTNGQRCHDAPSLDTLRQRVRQQMSQLPATYKQITARQQDYPVELSQALQDLAEQVNRNLGM